MPERVYQSPDGGWGWVVVLSAFNVHLIIDGITYAFGVLAAELVDELQASRQLTGWITSIMVGITLGAGPIASVASTKFGNRPVAMTGAVIGSIGFAVSYFATEAWMLVITIGCLVGLGMSLIYLPTIVTVGIYFNRLRSTALGIAVCGSGFGTFIFSPLISFLIQKYTWRGAMLILSGMLLNCAVFGSMFRPLPLLVTPLPPPPQDDEAATDEAGEATTTEAAKPTTEEAAAVTSAAADQPRQERPSSQEMQRLLHDGQGEAKRAERSRGGRGAAGRACARSAARSGGDGRGSDDFLSVQDMRWQQQKRQQQQRQQDGFQLKFGSAKRSFSLALEDVPKLEAAAAAATIQLTHVTRPVHFIRSITSIATLHDDEVEEGPPAKKSLREAIREEFSGIMSLSLLRNISFVLFLVSNLLGSIGFNAPFLFVPDRAQQAGYSRTHSSLLVSVIGISNMVGRVTFGFLSDRKWVNKLMLYNTALTIAGAVLVFSFVSNDYAFMAAYCSLFGIFIGTYVTLTSPVLVDLLGLEKLSDSFGLTLLFQGIGVLVGPPIAGFLFDSTLSFDIPFVVCGACVFISGIMLYPVPCILRWQYPPRGDYEKTKTSEVA